MASATIDLSVAITGASSGAATVSVSVIDAAGNTTTTTSTGIDIPAESPVVSVVVNSVS